MITTPGSNHNINYDYKENKIVVFILDFNRFQYTLRATKSVLESDIENIYTCILINGSEDENASHITEAFKNEPRVCVYKSKLNLGFTGGNNYLLNQITLQKNIPDYILLLNNDAYVDPDTISHLESVLLANPEIGIIGPRILKYGTDIIESDGARLWAWFMQQSFKNVGKIESDCTKTHPYKVPYVSGTCMMIHTDLFIKLEGFDDEFFAYFEDLDLCLRIRELGYKCFHVPNVIIRHIGSLTAGKDSFLYHYLMTRNRYLIARKHLSCITLICIFIPYFIISRVLYKTVALFFKGSLGGINGIYLALVWIIVPKKFKSRFYPIENKG